jgi:hypothetical protein
MRDTNCSGFGNGEKHYNNDRHAKRIWSLLRIMSVKCNTASNFCYHNAAFHNYYYVHSHAHKVHIPQTVRVQVNFIESDATWGTENFWIISERNKYDQNKRQHNSRQQFLFRTGTCSVFLKACKCFWRLMTHNWKTRIWNYVLPFWNGTKKYRPRLI